MSLPVPRSDVLFLRSIRTRLGASYERHTGERVDNYDWQSAHHDPALRKYLGLAHIIARCEHGLEEAQTMGVLAREVCARVERAVEGVDRAGWASPGRPIEGSARQGTFKELDEALDEVEDQVDALVLRASIEVLTNCAVRLRALATDHAHDALAGCAGLSAELRAGVRQMEEGHATKQMAFFLVSGLKRDVAAAEQAEDERAREEAVAKIRKRIAQVFEAAGVEFVRPQTAAPSLGRLSRAGAARARRQAELVATRGLDPCDPAAFV